MKIGVVKEAFPGECRVGATSNTVERLRKQGFEIIVQSGAGVAADFDDESYRAAGAEVLTSPQQIWESADIIVKVRPPMAHPVLGHEADHAREGQVVISLVFPGQNQELVDKLKKAGATCLALDCIPRITRAQRMDVLSSMANIAGYRAVIEAAHQFGSFFTGQHTAAGSVHPAKVLIVGAGVAGLAALGAARSLGAVVRAFDTRAAAREQVESLGGEFLEVKIEESGEGGGGYAKVMSKEFIAAEMSLFLEQAKEVDIVITTALIPGKKAPILWTEDHVKAMKPGSVVIDLAAEQGGNCECTQPGKIYIAHGVKIVGYGDLPSRMAHVSSDLFGTNVAHLCDELGGAENFAIDTENEIVRGALVTHQGEIMWPPPKREAPAPAPSPPPTLQRAAETPTIAKPTASAPTLVSVLAVLAAGLWCYLRFGYEAESSGLAGMIFVQHLTVFVLACFVGWQVVWNVRPALHTPLMSVTNAVSGIIIVGGLAQANSSAPTAAVVIGALAVLFATINIFGGFYVTQRMLQMFRK